MRHWRVTVLLAGLALAPSAPALPPVPYHEIVETVRQLAAQELGRRSSEVDTTRSLFAQGLSENGLAALMSAVQGEFGVVFRDDEITRRKWSDAASPLTVRRIAEMVEKQMREAPPL